MAYGAPGTIRPIVPCIVRVGESERATYAMLDCAATSSAILLEIVDSVKGEIFELPCKLSTFDSCQDSTREFCNFEVMPLDRSFTLDVQNGLVGTILTTEQDQPPRNLEIAQHSYLSDVHFDELDDPTIGLILDAKWAYTWLGGEIRSNSPTDVIGLHTKFGWTLIGPSNLETDVNETRDVSMCAVDSQELSLQQQIRTMFRHDFIMAGHEVFPHEQTHNSVRDDFSLEQMENSIELDPTLGHYKVAIPWKEGRSAAARIFENIDSYSNAKSRLMKEKYKFMKDPARKEGVFKQINETLSLGHARVVNDRNLDGLPKWYMPIHVVTRPDKPGKFRVCQDAASKVKNTYLNEHLCPGPDMLNSLVGVLFRFRKGRVAVSADIKTFFHMIHVADEDVAAFRFLFFKDESMREIVELESLVHIFGASSSPPVANFTLKYHADRIREKYGDEIFWQIVLQFYVDDYISSFDSPEKAREMRLKITAALAEGGFTLTKWSSTHPEVLIDDVSSSPSSLSLPLSSQPSQDVASTGEITVDENPHPSEKEEEKEEEEEENDEIVPFFEDSSLSQATKEFIQGPEQGVTTSTSKVLGLGYDETEDTLFVRVTDRAKDPVTTKRHLLKLTASVYDPIGLASPYVLKGRLFFQRANELNLDWDDRLPDDLITAVNEWKDSIQGLNKVKIDRWTSILGYEDCLTDLAVFSDSSAEGYGVCAYLRKYLKNSEDAYVTFFFAKAHVVPLSMSKGKIKDQEDHGDSMPRLELNAARLAAIVRDLIVRESGETFTNTYMFTDSLTVLTWINDLDKKFKTFENFRLKRIRLLTEISDWRHVPTDQNPADICSHGLNARDSDIDAWKFFLKGPSWLQKSKEEWPPIWPANQQRANVKIASTMATITAEKILAPSSSSTPITAAAENFILKIVEKTRTWSGKVRKVGRMARIFATFTEYLKLKKSNSNSKLKSLKLNLDLSLSDYQTAEKRLIRAIQLKHFEKEFVTLMRLGVFSPNSHAELRAKSSQLTHLNPFIDDGFNLRAGSRLINANTVSYDYKFPFILPSKDENVEALIRHEHLKLAHASNNHLFHAIRERFRIIGGRNTIDSVLRRCVTCQLQEKKSVPQKLGILPSERVNLIRPFQASSCDCFGPFKIKHGGRKTSKRWVLLINCMATRAIHLLPLKDMSSSTVINALIKFHNLFPGLEVMYSDNGTNFKGASKEIKEAVKAWNKKQINDSLLVRGIEWKWSPPHAPHYGGVWERLVRSAKRHLKFIFEKEELDVDTFETALTTTAAVLNTRPLTHASPDINDMQTLSPANFLYPYTITHSSTTILPPIPADGDTLRGAWRDVRRLTEEFKSRFAREYLSTIDSRNKWLKSAPPLYPGQIVILSDETEARKDWQLARIEECISNEKTHGHRYRIKTADGRTFDRHHNHLIPLELEREESEKK